MVRWLPAPFFVVESNCCWWIKRPALTERRNGACSPADGGTQTFSYEDSPQHPADFHSSALARKTATTALGDVLCVLKGRVRWPPVQNAAQRPTCGQKLGSNRVVSPAIGGQVMRSWVSESTL